jgi:hypothetical protein
MADDLTAIEIPMKDFLCDRCSGMILSYSIRVTLEASILVIKKSSYAL